MIILNVNNLIIIEKYVRRDRKVFVVFFFLRLVWFVVVGRIFLKGVFLKWYCIGELLVR